MFNPLFLPTIRKVKPIIIPNSGASVDGSGYLSLNPTLGSELISNGGFDSDSVWTKGTGWTITGGKAVATNVGAGVVLSQPILTVGLNYRIGFDLTTYTSGSVRVQNGAAFGYPYSALGNYLITGASAGSTGAGLNAQSTLTAQFDNLSAKLITGGTDLFIRRPNPDSIKISLDSLKLNQSIFFFFFSDNVFQQNCLRLGIGQTANDQFTLALRKFVGGVNTALISQTAATFVDGAELELRRLSVSSFAIYYNNVQIGTNQTVTDSSIINNDYHGIRSTSENWKIRSIKFNDVPISFNV